MDGEKEEGWVATCMKEGTGYKGKTLLGMPPVSTRLKQKVSTTLFVLNSTSKEHILEEDEHGNKFPFGPGECIPLKDLKPDHMARWYLENRGYDVGFLYDKFRTSFCKTELTPTTENGVYYPYLIKDWKDTPQGRVVFFGYMNGIRKGWQARLIEAEDDEGNIYYYHPYKHEMVKVATGKGKSGKPHFIPELTPAKFKWPPSKYKNGTGQSKSGIWMGYDPYIEHIKDIPRKDRHAVLTEGPLDAARFGFEGLPMCGPTVSYVQASKIKESTDLVFYARDNDDTGKASVTKAVEMLSSVGLQVVLIAPPDKYKDFGEMSDKKCESIIKNNWPKSK
jgi:hypothetical protein